MDSYETFTIKMRKVNNQKKNLKTDPETVVSTEYVRTYGIDRLNLGETVHELDSDS